MADTTTTVTKTETADGTTTTTTTTTTGSGTTTTTTTGTGTADGKNTSEEGIDLNDSTLKIKKPLPDNMRSEKEIIKRETEYRQRGKEQALMTDFGSVSVKRNGAVGLSSGHWSHIHLNQNGSITETGNQISSKSDRYTISSKDIIINNHKLNSKLYELADFRAVLSTYDSTPRIAGGLTMFGTVLVKTWEPNLKRYVLMRRLVNIPMFSPSLGADDPLKGLKAKPDQGKIDSVLNGLNPAGMTSYAQLASQMQQKQLTAISAQEAATAASNEQIRKENEKKQATSMTSLTEQNGSGMGGGTSMGGTGTGGTVAAGTSAATGAAGTFNASPSGIAAQAQANQAGANSSGLSGWDDANGRPTDPNAVWYKVQCGAKRFYVMQGNTAVTSYSCNTSNFGRTANKIGGDNKTPLGVFTLGTVDTNCLKDVLSKGCKIPNEAGVFGPCYIYLDLGDKLNHTSYGIAIHGDYPSEDAAGVLLNDAPSGRDAVKGEGSTHGCVRLRNSDIQALCNQYAKSGQFIKIED